ncbi:hypothetical protein ATK74_1229 [Propionicimonas paludicola]|uniref:Uncharacterized protein n=1 Tax=Propionicimonas paludicola TaxID=185243 RepID=A0A2A9CQQ7_9ACTN|nr:hypothetical protein [Propionicimonas paludicola]PFG16678.1 hypothetical protein ATK74_1229 [Propionicimonas paludicola]
MRRRPLAVRLAFLIAACVVLVGGVIVAMTVSRPTLSTVSEGFELCVPANPSGEALFGWDVFRNDSGRPVTLVGFAPDQAAGISVIGGRFLLDEEPGPRGAQDDPALIPSSWTPRTVPPGATVTLVIGLRLTDPAAKGSLRGGVLVSDWWGPLSTVAKSTTVYILAPTNSVC